MSNSDFVAQLEAEFELAFNYNFSLGLFEKSFD